TPRESMFSFELLTISSWISNSAACLPTTSRPPGSSRRCRLRPSALQRARRRARTRELAWRSPQIFRCTHRRADHVCSWAEEFTLDSKTNEARSMIFHAPESPLTIPEVALTPFLLARAADRGDKPAFIDGPSGRTLTYRGWADAVRRVAAGLHQRGFRKGDVFAIYSSNLPEYAVIFHAVSLLGGVNTTINPL